MAAAKKRTTKQAATKQRGNDAPVRFEDALEKLEEAVADLESGELGIDDALAKYEAGITQLRRCQQILKQAEQRVDELLRDADGELGTSPLTPAEGDDA